MAMESEGLAGWVVEQRERMEEAEERRETVAEKVAGPDRLTGGPSGCLEPFPHRPGEPVYRRDLVCAAVRLTYDFTKRAGTIELDEYHCTSMNGCIALFEGIDPQVELIVTRAAKELDTVYARVGGEWKSRLPEEAHFHGDED